MSDMSVTISSIWKGVVELKKKSLFLKLKHSVVVIGGGGGGGGALSRKHLFFQSILLLLFLRLTPI